MAWTSTRSGSSDNDEPTLSAASTRRRSQQLAGSGEVARVATGIIGNQNLPVALRTLRAQVGLLVEPGTRGGPLDREVVGVRPIAVVLVLVLSAAVGPAANAQANGPAGAAAASLQADFNSHGFAETLVASGPQRATAPPASPSGPGARRASPR
jgi:hypothetical protein